MSSHPGASEGMLARRVLPGVEVFAQSIATVSPSGVVAITPLIVALNAGNGTWLAFAMAMLAILLIGYCVAQFSRRVASSGSLYTYAARGLGSIAGFATGWGLVIAYVTIAMISMVAAGVYFGAFLTEIGIAGDRLGVQIALYAIFGTAAAAVALRGVRLSTRFALVMEIVAITAILTVLLIVFFDTGLESGSSQFGLEGVSFDGLVLGVVFAILAFSGFESSASLGAEARDPYRSITRAILLTILGCGALYVFAGYTEVIAFVNHGQFIGDSFAPLNDVAAFAGAEWLKYPIDIGATASFFACVTASVNAASRILFTMGRESAVPGPFGRAHHDWQTPHVAILALTPLVLLLPIVLVAQGTAPIDAITHIGTTGAFGFMLAYALVSLSAIPFVRRLGSLKPPTLVAGVCGAAAMAYVFYKNIVPTPPEPFDRLPYLFAVLLLIGLLWYAASTVRGASRGRLVGTTGDQLPQP